MIARLSGHVAGALACAFALLHLPKACAVDLDVDLNIRERTEQAAAHCAALRRGPAPDTASGYYWRGLCLLYGSNGTQRPEQAIASLRRAASLDDVEAQIALADYFQVASPARPDDALYWYARADRLGDSRAGGRADHLKRRIALDASCPEPPPGTVVDPTPMELQSLYRDRYHCHTMYGKQWCHLANDF
jgi:TPR repeat protein